jgi:hypothetical protein
MPEKMLIIHSLFVHVNIVWAFVCSAWTLSKLPKAMNDSLKKRNEQKPVLQEIKHAGIIHAIIIPNFNENIDTLRTTLSVLASHPRAYSQYKV